MREPVYNRSSKADALPPQRAIAFRSGMLTLLLAMVVASSGCCTLHRDKNAARMIQARELTYSGIRAEQEGQLGKAESIYANAVEMSPGDENARTRYAESLAARGDLDKAIAHLSEARRISHNDPAISIRIGELYLQKGDRNSAMQSADHALRVDRKLADAWNLKGQVHASADQTEQALANYLRALTCGSSDPEIQMAVADCYMKLGRHQRALSNLDLAATEFSSGNEPEKLLLMQSDAYLGMNRTSDAVDVLARLAARPNASPDAWHRYGNALIALGDTVNARLVLQSAAGKFPEERRIDESLARLSSMTMPVSMNR